VLVRGGQPSRADPNTGSELAAGQLRVALFRRDLACRNHCPWHRHRVSDLHQLPGPQAPDVSMIATRPVSLIARVSGALRALKPSPPAALRLAQVAAFFALVTSLRLLFVHLYGVDLPYSDQWDSEGWNWLKPYQEGSGINWHVLFL